MSVTYNEQEDYDQARIEVNSTESALERQGKDWPSAHDFQSVWLSLHTVKNGQLTADDVKAAFFAGMEYRRRHG